jgi:hypothetical protein
MREGKSLSHQASHTGLFNTLHASWPGILTTKATALRLRDGQL